MSVRVKALQVYANLSGASSQEFVRKYRIQLTHDKLSEFVAEASQETDVKCLLFLRC